MALVQQVEGGNSLHRLAFDDGFYGPQAQEALDNIAMSLTEYGDLPRLAIVPAHERRMAVVGGGPSLKGQLEALRAFDGDIFCVNEAHDYLIDHSIHPDGFVFLEVAPWPGDDGLCNRESDCTYYIPSHSHLSAFDRVKGRGVVMWHAHSDIGEDEVIGEFEDDPMLVAGSSAPGLRTIHIGMVLGYRRFDLFGLDASHSQGEHHAYHAHGRTAQKLLEITCAGSVFQTEPYLARQADEFARIIRTFPLLDIRCHGNGLIQHIHRSMRPDIY